MTDLSIELHKLFSEGNYAQIVSLIPASEGSDLSTGERLTLGLALFCIARPNQAICEIAIAAERATSSEERRVCIQYLVEILGLMGKDYEAEYCLQELEILGMKVTSNSNRLVSIPNLEPFHVQIEHFPEAAPSLPSLAKLSTEAYAMCQATSRETTLFTNKSKLQKMPLNSLYQAIVSCSPLYVFDILNLEAIDTIVQKLRQDFPANINLNSTVDILQHVEAATALQTMEFLDKIALICLVCAFSAKLQERSNANNLFLQLIDLIETVRKTHPLAEFIFSKGQYLNETTKRSAILHLAYNLGVEIVISDTDNISLSLLEEICTKNDIYTEYMSGRLWQYYASMAMFYEKMAYHDCTVINIWPCELKNSPECMPDIAIRLNFDFLHTMVQRIIVAVTAQPHDDPAAVFLYCRLLWGLLMMGGLSYSCVYIFKNIRDYFLDHFSSGPLQTDPTFLHCEFVEKDVLGELQNGCKITDLICSTAETVRANDFLTPQVFIDNETLAV